MRSLSNHKTFSKCVLCGIKRPLAGQGRGQETPLTVPRTALVSHSTQTFLVTKQSLKRSAFIYIFYIYCFSLYSNNSRPKIDIIKIISCVSFYIMRLISMEIKIKFAKSFVQGKLLYLAQT